MVPPVGGRGLTQPKNPTGKMSKDGELDDEAYHVGLAGEPHRAWRRLLFDAGAEKTDEAGWTLTDCLMALDYGNPGVILPAGSTAAEIRKATALRQARVKGSYALIMKRIKDKDLKHIISTSYLQDGFKWRGAGSELRQPPFTSVCGYLKRRHAQSGHTRKYLGVYGTPMASGRCYSAHATSLAMRHPPIRVHRGSRVRRYVHDPVAESTELLRV